MTITAQAEDGIEPVSDSVWELTANSTNYNVISGCAVTYDAANMTLDIAAGSITHNGSTVAVSAQVNALTLVADGSNPRWSWISLDSSGVAVLVSGDPLASPAVPELGDRVALALVRVEAGQTIANNITYKLDKRIMGVPSGWSLAGSSTTEATMTSATAADLVTITGLSIPATTPVMIITNFRKSANAFQPSIGLKVNSTVVIEANTTTVTRIGGFSTDAEVQNGVSVVYLGPRRTNYDKGISGFYSAGGVGGVQTATIPGAAIAAAIPIATITDIIIRGDSDGTNTLGVHGVYVYTGPV